MLVPIKAQILNSKPVKITSLLFFGAAFLMVIPAAMAQTRPELLKTFRSEFVDITPGEGNFPATFSFGSDAVPSAQPVQKVLMTVPFSIGKYEVTQNLYESVMGSNPSRWKGVRNSVEQMNWHDANEFCSRATKLMRVHKLISADQEIRLPTEVQWEYCCRAGTATAFSFGDQAQANGEKNPIATLLDPYGWHTGNAAGNDPAVGQLKPNPWGLYDMHGYLWEYCSDDWIDQHDQKQNANDGAVRNEQAKTFCVLKGGSWRELHSRCSSAARKKSLKKAVRDDIGLRCVLIRVEQAKSSEK